jgi:acyl carrier protein
VNDAEAPGGSMTERDAHALVAEVLGRIAPEVPLDDIDPASDLRDEMDLDSMDFLNFVTALHERTGLDIPERDYPELSTLAGAIAYLSSRT